MSTTAKNLVVAWRNSTECSPGEQECPHQFSAHLPLTSALLNGFLVHAFLPLKLICHEHKIKGAACLNMNLEQKGKKKISVQCFCWLGLVCIFGTPYGVFCLHTTMVGMDVGTIHGWIWEPHNTSLFWGLGQAPVPWTHQSPPPLSFHDDLISMLRKLWPMACESCRVLFDQILIWVSSTTRP